MKRVQLFEFEDFNWFPEPIRQSMTNLIVVFHNMVGTQKVIARIINHVKKRHPFSQIVDMGSGSGGAMPGVLEELNKNSENKTELLLTDLHPSKRIVEAFNQDQYPHIRYAEKSTDATNFKTVPEGLKTMINSFHHIPQPLAKKILLSAQETKEPFLIYEMAENKIPLILWWLFLPFSLVILIVMSLFMTPFVKKITWQQLVFTYLIPIIPICYAWDGQASLVRMYTFSDLNELLLNNEDENYTWEMQVAKKENGKALGYYLLGLPKTAS